MHAVLDSVDRILIVLFIALPILSTMSTVLASDLYWLNKGSEVSYVIIKYSNDKPVSENYYIVRVLDKFQGENGPEYRLEVQYYGGGKTVKDTFLAHYYELSEYLPLPIEQDMFKILERGSMSYSLPMPIENFNTEYMMDEPITYTTLKLNIVNETTYKLIIGNVNYSFASLLCSTKYRGYNVKAYIDKDNGLLLELRIYSGRNLIYRVVLAIAPIIYNTSNNRGISSEGLFNEYNILVVIIIILAISIGLTIYKAYSRISKMIGEE
jgi:hypothetical protein